MPERGGRHGVGLAGSISDKSYCPVVPSWDEDVVNVATPRSIIEVLVISPSSAMKAEKGVLVPTSGTTSMDTRPSVHHHHG